MSDRHQDSPARLRLHPTAFVAPGATVVGEVTLGEHASVWFGTVVRGDGAPITIGAHTNLQDLTLVHVDEDAPTTAGASSSTWTRTRPRWWARASPWGIAPSSTAARSRTTA